MKQALDIITKDQIAELRENGYVVIHREPTHDMAKAFYGKQWPECVSFAEGFHRMVACSIRKQNAASGENRKDGT